MILGSMALRHQLEVGGLVVTPFVKTAVQPTSIDLHLADDFLIPKSNAMDGALIYTDPKRPVEYSEVTAPDILIPAFGFLLARTRERVSLDENLTGFVEGRSSVGRLGLFIQNAGWVDPGFDGTITLELFNALPNPVKLYAGMRICQLVVAEARDAEAYKGKYQGQMATRGSELWRDFRAL